MAKRLRSSSPDTAERQVDTNVEELQRIRSENTNLLGQLSATRREYEHLRNAAGYEQGLRENIQFRNDQMRRLKSECQMITLLARDSVGPSDRSIRQGFELVATDIRDACSSMEITNSSSSLDANAETDAWARRIAQRSFSQFFDSAIDAGVSDSHIIRALASAAISELVFESRFPDFLAYPLLDQYRRDFSYGGSRTLYQLDFPAHDSVSEAELQHAAALSTTFHNTVAHLISPNEQTIVESDGPFSMTEEDKANYPPTLVAQVFMDTFIHAVQLKQSLVLSRSEYKLVFPAPGDRFDPGTMRRDGDGDSAFVPERVKRRKHNHWPRLLEIATGSEINLCLFPAVYSKPGKLPQEGGPRVGMEDYFVKCNNVVKGNPSTGLDGFTLVVKAVVLV